MTAASAIDAAAAPATALATALLGKALPPCGNCGRPREKVTQRWCRLCRAVYCRAWRAKHVMVSRETLQRLESAAVSHETATLSAALSGLLAEAG